MAFVEDHSEGKGDIFHGLMTDVVSNMWSCSLSCLYIYIYIYIYICFKKKIICKYCTKIMTL